MRLFFGISIAAVIILILLFAFGYFGFLYLLHRRKSDSADVQKPTAPARYGKYEERIKKATAEYDKAQKQICTITSNDGLKLCGYFVSGTKKTSKLIIAFHGYHSSPRADFSPVFKQLLDAGCSLLLVDQRSHGRSEGRYIGFGALEKADALRWCEYAVERFGKDVNIYLYGISMGAATVTLASQSRLPSQVKGVIADCGFSSPSEIIRHVLKNERRIPTFPIMHFVNLWTKLIAGYDLTKHSSEEAIKQSKLPFLLIHGAEDRYVPTEMSQTIFNARADNTRLVIVEGAKHARSHLENEELYLNEMIEFIENN